MRRILAFLIWAGWLAVGSNAAQAAAAGQIQVGYTNTTSCTGLFIAVDQGMFAKRGLDVRLTLLALNSTIPSALVGGSIQIGTATPSVLLQAVTGGLDLVVIAGGAVNDVHKLFGGAVARADLNIRTARDFEGKRVGVPGLGAFMHVLFRRWLVEHGADDRKVNFVEVPLAQERDLLRSGNVDAVISGEPFFSRIIASKSGTLVAPFFTEMPDGLFMLYFSTTRVWAKNNAAAIGAFRAALEEATAFLAANPAGARASISKYTHLPADVIASIALPTLRLKVPGSDVKYWSDTLLAQGMIKVPPDTARLVVD
jgi:NitT/TauT family transport system substrate-binding protein